MDSDNSIVCTLFEGHYHYGLAALVNSLYSNGFRGDIYAGYRGELPPWATPSKTNKQIEWEGTTTMQIARDLSIHFLPVAPGSHLANFKPVFMLQLARFTNKGIFYFDPDIVVKSGWDFFENWIQYGVAVVQEVVSNNFSPYHPKRMQWQPVVVQSGRTIQRHLYHILNSGFCGVSIINIEFLETWKDITDTAVKYFSYQPGYFLKHAKHTDLFIAGDQDMMNIAAMCCTSLISDIGPEGMDFIHGGWLMSHATGNPKPWKINYLKKALSGNKISLAEKNYWTYVNKGIITHKNEEMKRKKLSIKAASLINRFYVKT